MNSKMGHVKPDARFSLDASSGVPVYRQLIEQVENAVVSGRLQSGDRLPTIRALSVSLKINPNTIAKAYNELEIRGILKTQVGSGTFIAGKSAAADYNRRQAKITEALGRFLREMSGLGLSRAEIIQLVELYKGADT
jgi:GntR family transcriptional regulator